MLRYAVIIGIFCVTSPAFAEKLEGSTLGAIGGSSDEDDGALLSVSRVAVASDRGFAIFGVGIAGYAARDVKGSAAKHRRILTGLGAGAMLSRRYGFLKPRVGLALILQNERNISEALDDPVGTVVGSGGDTLRRTGAMGTGGVDIRLWHALGLELFATAEVSVTQLFDDEGPRTYVAAGAGLGARIEFSLGRAPRSGR